MLRLDRLVRVIRLPSPGRLVRFLVTLLVGLWLTVGASPGLLRAQPSPSLATTTATSVGRVIPIGEQPFYPELEEIADHWRHAPLWQVVGDSQRETLLNFYAVMAQVDQEIHLASRNPDQDPGLLWSPAAKQHIASAERLFGLAVRALDASVFPESVRDDMADEAAMQLKHVLDYVFTRSAEPITIPDSAELKRLNSQRSQVSESWTIPNTAISLSREETLDSGNPGFLFSAGTVSQIARMYGQISGQPVVQQPFATPEFYRSFIYTPGFLVPPKWYLRLPPGLRRFLELPLDGQTLLQIVATLSVLILYGWILLVLFRRLLQTYRYLQADADPFQKRAWHQDNLAWYRVLLLLPILPLTRFSEIFIDDYVNFTGTPLVVVTYLFFISYFVSASFFFFFLFEALGRTLTEWLVRLRGGGSELQLRRVSNLVMPVGRVMGGFVAVALIYRLLIVLGLPSSTVLAFSAVPGLAIGLGASKLLGNLFAGLSIQTDRPLRVGEFCSIGDNLGFVTKIGLRSLELQTLTSRVTIPNSIADEQTIVNYSRRSRNSGAAPCQAMDVRLTIEERLHPEQVDDLLQLVRTHLGALPQLIDPLVSLEQSQADQLTLICFAMVNLQDWPTYLQLRELLLLRLQQLVEQVRLSSFVLGISYDTTAEQLRLLPEWMQEEVNSDPDFVLQACRLMVISEFTYNIALRLHGHQSSLRAFKDAIHALNQRLLLRLAREGVEIPFPTSVQFQRDL